MSPLTLEEELLRVEQQLHPLGPATHADSMSIEALVVQPFREPEPPVADTRFVFRWGGPFDCLVKSFFPAGFRQG